MRIAGKWHRCEDGTIRPVVDITVSSAGNGGALEVFLIDSCSDCTVLSAHLIQKTGMTGRPAPSGISLKGISGSGTYVVVGAVLEFVSSDSGPARVRGEMAAFTDPAATDMSILGRDVLDHFDVI